MDNQDTMKLKPLVIACLVASLAALLVTLAGGLYLAQQFQAIDYKGIVDKMNEENRRNNDKARAWLVVLRGRKPGMKYPLYEGKNYLGRIGARPVDIDLTFQEGPDQPLSSEEHAVITITGTEMVLEDAKSDKGTFVNRERVTPDRKVTLQAKDIVQIGTVQLEVVK